MSVGMIMSLFVHVRSGQADDGQVYALEGIIK